MCLGRRDTQIKIHGVRLECGHIESKIGAALPADATVVVDKIYSAGKQLLGAFLTLPQFGSSASASGTALLENTPQIREFVAGLQQRLLGELQSWMVPNVFLPVTTIPLGTTGKTNRRALRTLAASLPEGSLSQFAASRCGGDEALTRTTSPAPASRPPWPPCGPTCSRWRPPPSRAATASSTSAATPWPPCAWSRSPPTAASGSPWSTSSRTPSCPT